MSFNKKPPKWTKGSSVLSDYIKTAGWESGDNPSASALNNNPGTYYEAIEELQAKAGALKTINKVKANEDGSISVDVKRITSKEEFKGHTNATVYNSEVHGLRIFNGLLQHHDGEQWQSFEKQAEGRYGIDGITGFTIKLKEGIGFALRWAEPVDKLLEDNTAIKWSHTVIVRKENDYPTSVNDGVQVISNGVRNQYAFQDLIDARVNQGVVYYYAAFVYSQDGTETYQKLSIGTYPLKDRFVDRSRIYGVEIDLNDPHPSNAVTYIEAAEDTVPGSDVWWERYPFSAIRPVLLENGVVDAELNPNDYTRDINGIQINPYISGTGDVMIEFPLLYWKVEHEGTKMRIYCSGVKHDADYHALAHTRDELTIDSIFIGAYNGRFVRRRSDAMLDQYYDEVYDEETGTVKYDGDNHFDFSNGAIPFIKPVSASGGNAVAYDIQTIKRFLNEGEQDRNYTILNINHLHMIQVLFILFYKTLDSTNVLGEGMPTPVDTRLPELIEYNLLGTREKGAKSTKKTGVLDKSGMNAHGVDNLRSFKLFGIENLFGGSPTVIDGIYVDEDMNYKVGFEYLDEEAAKETIESGADADKTNIVGMMKKPLGDYRTGFLPSLVSTDTVGGSNSTYYGDRFAFEKNKYVSIGYHLSNILNPESYQQEYMDKYQKNMSGLMSVTAGNEPGYISSQLVGTIGNKNTYPEGYVVRPVYTPGIYDYSYLNFEDVDFEEYNISGFNNQSRDDGILQLLMTLPTSETTNRIIIFDSRNQDLSRFKTTEELFNAVYRPSKSGALADDNLKGESNSVTIDPNPTNDDPNEFQNISVTVAPVNNKESRYYEYYNVADHGYYNITPAGRKHYIAAVIEHVTYTANGQPILTYTEPAFGEFEVIDIRPPYPVRKLDAKVVGKTGLELSIYANGSSMSVWRILVVMKKGTMPKDQYDGTPVYDSTFVRDSNLTPIKVEIGDLETNQEYWFRAFTFDPDGNMNDILEEFDKYTYYCQYLGTSTAGYPAVENLRIRFSPDGLLATVDWDKPVTNLNYIRTDIYISTENIMNMPITDVLKSPYLAYSGPELTTTYNAIPGSTYYVRAFSYYLIDGYDQHGRNASTYGKSTDNVGPGPVRDFNGIGIDKDRILLSWVNPTHVKDYYATTIVHKKDGYPTSMTDGETIYYGGGTYTLVRDLEEGMHYFRAFTHDDKNNISSDDVDSAKVAIEAKTLPKVEDFTLDQHENGIEVYASWKAPVTPFLESIQLYASLDAGIKNRSLEECKATDTLVYEGLGGNATHYFVEPDKTYHYKVFIVYDFFDIAIMNYSAYKSVFTSGDTTPPGPVTNLSIIARHMKGRMAWENPTDEDFEKTVIVRKIGATPTSLEDGTIIYEGAGEYFEDSDVSDGVTYHYRFFTYDRKGNVDTKVDVSDWITVFSDDIPPEKPVVLSVTGSEVSGYTIKGTTSEPDVTMEITAEGKTYSFAASNTAPFAWELTTPSNELTSAAIFEIVAKDIYGNTSPSVRLDTLGQVPTNVYSTKSALGMENPLSLMGFSEYGAAFETNYKVSMIIPTVIEATGDKITAVQLDCARGKFSHGARNGVEWANTNIFYFFDYHDGTRSEKKMFTAKEFGHLSENVTSDWVALPPEVKEMVVYARVGYTSSATSYIFMVGVNGVKTTMNDLIAVLPVSNSGTGVPEIYFSDSVDNTSRYSIHLSTRGVPPTRGTYNSALWHISRGVAHPSTGKMPTMLLAMESSYIDDINAGFLSHQAIMDLGGSSLAKPLDEDPKYKSRSYFQESSLTIEAPFYSPKGKLGVAQYALCYPKSENVWQGKFPVPPTLIFIQKKN